jgi:hypothetical protein
MIRTLVAVAGVVVTLFAAESASAEWQVGAWGGANRSRLDIEPTPLSAQLDARAGKSLGVVIEIPLSPRWALSLQPGYVERGTGFQVDTDGGLPQEPVRRDVHHAAVEVPALARFFPIEGSVQPYLAGGISIARLFRSGAGAIATSYSFPPFDYNKWDVALSGGIGIRLGRGPVRVFGEGRYTWGLVDLSPPLEADPAKNRVVHVMLGMTFRIAQSHEPR